MYHAKEGASSWADGAKRVAEQNGRRHRPVPTMERLLGKLEVATLMEGHRVERMVG